MLYEVITDESYMKLKELIITTLQHDFKTLDVRKKAEAKKDINYGNTAKPNNRAPYAKNVIAVTSGRITSYNVCYTKLLRLYMNGSQPCSITKPSAGADDEIFAIA